MSAAKKSSRLLDFALIFIATLLLSQFAMSWFFPKPDSRAAGVFLTMQADSLRTGNDAIAVVENRTDKAVTVPARCPRPPLDLFRVSGETLTPIADPQPAVPCETDGVTVEPGKTGDIPLSSWKYSAYAENGLYEVQLPAGIAVSSSGAVASGSGTVVSPVSARFDVHEPGVFVKLYRGLIVKPFLNSLVFIASVLPGHNLGLAIIILTILVKLLLFYPTQKSLEGQKKMQLLQPKLEEVRKKYKEDPQKQQEETVRLWKEHKINPFQSCLPILLQFPILIGLITVIGSGSNIDLSRHLLYGGYQHLAWTFDTNFLGLDLTVPHIWIFPPLLIVLQFIQMWLSFRIADKKKAKQIEKIEHGGVQTTEKSAQELQQKVMMYVLPLMIGFFALRYPSAVALYWGISTLFAIGQQIIVNREHLKV
jgi:YidC/Oxa1 family membrane protein insertase